MFHDILTDLFALYLVLATHLIIHQLVMGWHRDRNDTSNSPVAHCDSLHSMKGQTAKFHTGTKLK